MFTTKSHHSPCCFTSIRQTGLLQNCS